MLQLYEECDAAVWCVGRQLVAMIARLLIGVRTCTSCGPVTIAAPEILLLIQPRQDVLDVSAGVVPVKVRRVGGPVGMSSCQVVTHHPVP